MVRIPGVTQIDAGDNRVCAVTRGGRVTCWGRDGKPTAVEGLRRAVQVTVGGTHACARLTDQTVRCWGEGDNGQLGDGVPTAARKKLDAPRPVVTLRRQ